MESLYRTYRPLTFESVVGQQHIVATLEHAVTEGRLSHAYLFCGPRGTGKTTMARILAKALLCQHAAEAREAGGSGCLPDGTCEACQQIAEGTHPDVYELDAASRTGVDNVREEIIGSVNFAPVRGAYKIYIIDEVHMLTTAAFNALLKTLEEPPAHVVFVLCTTDPQKIPETILSRCQRFDFHRISVDDIVGRLTYICEQEHFSYDTEALEIVAKHARGGMRDALSTLEQLSVFGDGAVRAADARSLLGEVPGAVLSEFTKAIAARNTPKLFDLVAAQVDEGSDLMELTRDLVAHVRDVYKIRIAGAGHSVAGNVPAEEVTLADEGALFEGPDRLARTLTILDDAVLEMRTAPDMRLVLEIALTRLARPESDLTLEALADRIERLEAQLLRGIPAAPVMRTETVSAGSAPAAEVSVQQATQQTEHVAVPAQSLKTKQATAATKPASAAQTTAQPKSVSVTQPAVMQSDATQHRAVASQPAAPSQPVTPRRTTAPSQSNVSPQASSAKVVQPTAAEIAAAAASETSPIRDAGELQRRWADVVKRVIAAQPSRGALLQNARIQGDDGDTLTVSLPQGSSFAIKMLGREDTQSVILPQVSAVFGRRRVQYTMGGVVSTAQPAAAPQPAAATQPVPTSAPVSQAATQQASQPVQTTPPAASVSQMPAQPVSQPTVDTQASPTILPDRDIDADRKAWEDNQVPYDDDAVAFYEDEMVDEEVPPFDTVDATPMAHPAPVSTPASTPATVPVSAAAPSTKAVPQTQGAPAQESAVPAASSPFTHDAPAPSVPQTAEEAQELLTNIFGGGVVIKTDE